jgi:two-component system, OmpR family, alkaline phosphatase synthesis response regulator PhoP
MKKSRILVVDDEPDLVELVRHHLAREHYDVVTAADGETGLAEARRKLPDLVVLDLMLPGIDGLEVCRRLRSDPRTTHIPIVMLTAKGEESDAVIGLSQGADDYVRKPFGMKELVARIATRLRSADQRAPGFELQKVARFGDLVVDSVKHEVLLGDQPVKLTVTEFKLLRHLVQNRGRAFTRNELLNAVLGQDAFVIDRNVDVHVATLRKKLGEYGAHIQTIRGLGYKFRETPTSPD